MRLPARLQKPGYKILAAILLFVVILYAPKWSASIIRHMDFFHVRTIEIRGTRYLEPTDIVNRLRVDTTRSIVDDVKPLEKLLQTHPQIASVAISRRPPGTLVVTIKENLPVALVPRTDGVRPFDATGRVLPIDPSRTDLDLPLLSKADSSALATLAGIRASDPTLFGRISRVVWEGKEGLVFYLASEPGHPRSTRIRANVGVTPSRFLDIVPVEADLRARNEPVAELDLRYREQVIARLVK